MLLSDSLCYWLERRRMTRRKAKRRLLLLRRRTWMTMKRSFWSKQL